eukprot:Hpha_TRINITY_DN16023_c8_g2::TRINITY_DN16023_c8_g2_i1::g.120035::m.120035
MEHDGAGHAADGKEPLPSPWHKGAPDGEDAGESVAHERHPSSIPPPPSNAARSTRRRMSTAGEEGASPATSMPSGSAYRPPAGDEGVSPGSGPPRAPPSFARWDSDEKPPAPSGGHDFVRVGTDPSGMVDGQVPISAVVQGYGNPWVIREAGGLPTVWRRKTQLALRTGFASLLAAVFTLMPEVKTTKWIVPVLVPIIAIVGTGQSFGATIMFTRSAMKGSAIGALIALVSIQLTKLMADNTSTRDAVAVVFYVMGHGFLTSRPTFGLGETKLGCAVYVVSMIKTSAAAWNNHWYFPFQVCVTCAAGCLAALVANLLPTPALAHREIRARAHFQVRIAKALLAAQDLIVLSRESGSIAHSEHLLSMFEDNVNHMKALLPPAQIELTLYPNAAQRLALLLGYFDSLLPGFRGKQAALRKKILPPTQMQLRTIGITMPRWIMVARTVCSLLEEAVRAERDSRAVDREFVDDLEQRTKEFTDACDRARRDVVYPGGSLYVQPTPGEDRATHQMERASTLFFNRKLADAAKLAPVYSRDAEDWKQRCGVYGGLLCSMLRDFGNTFRQCPDRRRRRAAIKKTLALFIAGLLFFVHSTREAISQVFWVSLAVCFVFADDTGSSLNTGSLRVMGTLIGSLYGLYARSLLGRSEIGYAMAFPPWVVVVCLFRTSPRHGYMAVCGAFTAAIIMVGTMMGPDEGEDPAALALARMETNTAGALLFMAVENLLWPVLVRSELRHAQTEVITAIRDGLADALLPWVPSIEMSTRHVHSAPEEATLSTATASAAGTNSDPPLRASEGFRKVAGCQSKLDTADMEPALWRTPFPRNQYVTALHGEASALRIIIAIHAAVRSVQPEELTKAFRAPQGLEGLMLPELLGSFAVDAYHSLSRASKAWQRGSDGSAAVADDAAADVAAPFNHLSGRGRQTLQRGWLRWTEAWLQYPEPVCSESTTRAMHAVGFLLLELTRLLESVGEGLRAVRAQETIRVQL